MGKIHQLFRRSKVVALGGWEIVVISIFPTKRTISSWWLKTTPSKKICLSKWESSVMFGVKSPKIFELPPTRFMFGGSVFKQKDLSVVGTLSVKKSGSCLPYIFHATSSFSPPGAGRQRTQTLGKRICEKSLIYGSDWTSIMNRSW